MGRLHPAADAGKELAAKLQGTFRTAVDERSWSPNVIKPADQKPTLKAADYRTSGFWSKEIKGY